MNTGESHKLCLYFALRCQITPCHCFEVVFMFIWLARRPVFGNLQLYAGTQYIREVSRCHELSSRIHADVVCVSATLINDLNQRFQNGLRRGRARPGGTQ